jgi:hypothetical protein
MRFSHIALHAYWSVPGETLAFAKSERKGVSFVGPANALARAGGQGTWPRRAGRGG